jgi:hypothetical protein
LCPGRTPQVRSLPLDQLLPSLCGLLGAEGLPYSCKLAAAAAVSATTAVLQAGLLLPGLAPPLAPLDDALLGCLEPLIVKVCGAPGPGAGAWGAAGWLLDA